MGVIGTMLLAERLLTAVAFERKKIKLIAIVLMAMLSYVWKFHVAKEAWLKREKNNILHVHVGQLYLLLTKRYGGIILR